MAQKKTAKKAKEFQWTKAADIRALRDSLGLNQLDFWSPLGVTQSGGSRYESGRRVPSSVLTLLHIAYGSEAQAAAIVKRLRAHGA